LAFQTTFRDRHGYVEHWNVGDDKQRIDHNCRRQNGFNRASQPCNRYRNHFRFRRNAQILHYAGGWPPTIFCIIVPDTGNVSLTVDGFLATAPYAGRDTDPTIAQKFAIALNVLGSPV